VDWSKSYLAWVQLAGKNDKRVVELSPDPADEPVPGYFASRCRLSELADLPLAWKSQLRAAMDVCVLRSAVTRKHYVGSATGQDGFLGRWMQHSKARGDALGF